jgi:hypothetical protein
VKIAPVLDPIRIRLGKKRCALGIVELSVN